MRALGELGLADAVVDAGTVMRASELRTFRGDVVSSLSITELSRRHGAPSVLVWRSRLMEVLLAQCGDVVSYEKRFEKFVDDGDRVEVHFVDGTTESVDLLLGADGIWSRVRAELRGPEEPRAGRRQAWVGGADVTHPSIDVGVATTFLGTGVFVMIIGTGKNSAYWYATVADEDGVSDYRSLVRRFSSCHEPVAEVFARTQMDTVVATEVRDRPPSAPWSRGRVALLGDAAHTCAPDLGQGACQAIEGAVLLAKLLATEGATPTSAFRDYENSRYEKAGLVTAFSRGTLAQTALQDERLDAIWPSTLAWSFPILGPIFFDWLLGSSSSS